MDGIIEGSLSVPDGGPQRNVRVSNAGSGLRLSDGAHEIWEIPFNDVDVSVGGFEGTHVFCRAKSTGLSLMTADVGILDLLSRSGVPAVVEAVEAARAELRGARRGNWIGGAIALGFLALIGVLLWNVPNMVAASVYALPVDVDRALGDAAYDESQLGGPVIHEPAVDAFLNEVVDRLAEQACLDGLDFRVTVVESDQLNAFALPGGQIVVFTGLLRAAERPEQVAGVLAHEMAHATRRHGMRNVAHNVGLVVGLRLLLGDTSGWTGMAAETAALAKSNGYSRVQEADADAEGTRMLMAAGLDPEGLAEFFGLLQAEPGSELSGAMNWLSTHPDHQSRIDHVHELATQLEKATPQPLESDWGAVKAIVGDDD